MEYAYGNWLLVFLLSTFFIWLIYDSFKPKSRTDWRSFGMFAAFVIALFTEMYGFPLTIYLLTSYFGNRLGLDFSHESGHLLNKLLGISGDPHFSLLHIASYVLIIGGLLILEKAWKILYLSQRRQILVTAGPYRYIRHPQYLAFILIIAGFLLQWPTLITLIMAPVLMIRYIWLASTEEKNMLKKFGSKYAVYKKETPSFFPSIKKLIAKPRLSKHLLLPKIKGG
jgi:protein-S-isoprenylcysteine O-methyltransferase Ste14